MLTLVIFIVILGVLVFVHELGHFLVAKWNGIKSEEFGFGFPPRLVGVWKNEKKGKYEIVWGNKNIVSKNTVYSFNWIPLGGFVKIKGEDGHEEHVKDPESFAGRSAWTRIKVMGAGVFMNVLLAWLLLAIVLMMGFPRAVAPEEEKAFPDAQLQITLVQKDTPADTMGLRLGDEIMQVNGQKVESQTDVRRIIDQNLGQEITVDIVRNEQAFSFRGTPRTEFGAGQGPLGISMQKSVVESYPWYEAIVKGAQETYAITKMTLQAFGKMIAMLFGGEKVAFDVVGPVGIVYLTGQVNDLGLEYLLRFAALLSINLAIINILPIPALDGGRILFVLIEKLRGRPVSIRAEGMIHQVGFILLILLMFFVTLRDFAQFDVLQRIGNLF